MVTSIQKLPKHYKYHGSSVLEISSTIGHPVIGYIIFIAGLFFLGISTGLIPNTQETISPDIQKLLVGASLCVFILGFYLGFWTSHAYIDKVRQTLLIKTGVFGWGHSENYPLSNFGAIKLGFIGGDSDSNDQYPIQLVRQDLINISPTLSKPYDFQQAQTEIDILKDFLQWPSMDMTVGPVSHMVSTDIRKSKDLQADQAITFALGQSMLFSVAPTSVLFLFLLCTFWDVLTRNLYYMAEFLLVWSVITLMIIRKHRKPPAMITLSIGRENFEMSSERHKKSLIIPLTEIRSLSLYASEKAWANKILLQTNSVRHEVATGLSATETERIYDFLKSRM